MGLGMIDQYSILHFASGVVAYFWGVPFLTWMVLHILFEIVENTQIGMKFINEYFTLWPGGKGEADTFINSGIGDNLFAAMGWLVSNQLDKFYSKITSKTSSARSL
jgi:hypothetical protein